MTIRNRMTIWYAGILFASTVLISALAYRELSTDIPSGSKTEPHSQQEEEEEQAGVVEIILWCGIPAAFLGVGGGWWLMRKAMSPITLLTQAVSGLHESNLREQLPRSGNGDELDRLTEVFNAMTGRMDASFARIREFTLHASHELKTPLTVMRGELETALRDEADPLRRSWMLNQLDEIQRLTRIVDGLTLLTKADAGLLALEKVPVQLDELVRDCVEDAHILAQPQSVNVELSRCDPVTIQGDRHRIRQLLLNLTDNAIKYNHVQGQVTVALIGTREWAELSVTNTGPGIPKDIQTRVFDRFFRGDPSHNSNVEGCGLGLTIAQWIATAHGGTIEVASDGGLTTFTVKLPRK